MENLSFASGHYVSFSSSDIKRNVASTDVQAITVYPGQVVRLTGVSQVIDDGVLVCEEPLREVTSFIAPELNGAGLKTTLQNTTFLDPMGRGDAQWGYNTTSNPVGFALWDPSILQYNFTMTGKGCTDYNPEDQTVFFSLNVRHFSAQEMKLNTTRSVCPSVSYNPQSNKAGLLGANPVIANKTGCSIVYDILSAPYVAQFGALQILSSGAMGVALDKNATQSVQILFEESSKIDCSKDSRGQYKTISSIYSVPHGANTTVAYTSSPSVFLAPYYSSSCNSTSVPPKAVGSYNYYGTDFDTYLMMKPQGAWDSLWVPVKKVSWSLDTLNAKCMTADACGTGPNSNVSYVNPSWIVSGSSLAPKIDEKWQSSATFPKWFGIVQESRDVVLMDGHPGKDYWYFCPSGQAIEEGGPSVTNDVDFF